MVEFARQTPADLADVSFLLADARDLHLAAEFDIAFSNSTLHWKPDHPAALRGLHWALKPGRRMFHSMSGRGTAAVVLSVINGLAEHEPWR
jgi:trans-aconitate methyltransferase